MLFNFFKGLEKKEENVINQEKLLARVTYSFLSDSTSPIIDVELDEYNDECVKALSNIVSTIGEEGAYLETVNIIKNSMISDKQESYFIELVTNLTRKSRKKIIDVHNNNELDQPCIKPSEML